MALPCWRFLVRVRVNIIFYFVNIVNSEQCAGEGGEFSEGDEEGVVDLSAGVDGGSPKEENHSTDGEDGGCQELYEVCVIHRRFFKSGAKVRVII